MVEARDELHRMLNEDELRNVVLLVFANKLRSSKFNGCYRDYRQAWSSFSPPALLSTCATSGEGLYGRLDWLSNDIANKG
ncbi:hypothetical protein J1N35_001623 [Gossypium stocksii]|uniref:Uncharacterized protein n=1 Tax=Gossypium stocksii TaxID=47602 RepID=A0A9D4AJT1_9ROSI|nr:hypothetical protein J1N35_001623 [Gossypium stocksii]